MGWEGPQVTARGTEHAWILAVASGGQAGRWNPMIGCSMRFRGIWYGTIRRSVLSIGMGFQGSCLQRLSGLRQGQHAQCIQGGFQTI